MIRRLPRPARSLLLLLVLAVGSALAVAGYAQGRRAPLPVVGTRTLTIFDDSRQRQLPSEVWFLARDSSSVESFSPLPPIQALQIAREADPRDAASKHPLIVMSHGNWGTRYSQGWLAERLVRDGYIVVSVTHPGTAANDQTSAGLYRLWDRSADVSFVLDQILRSPVWSPLIDERRIGFVGHSFGGWAGVSLAGGRFDPERQRAFCLANQIDFYCRGVAEQEVSTFDSADAARSYRDRRFNAFYIMGSGPAQGFDSQSLQAINTPMLVDSALRDEILDVEANSRVFAQLIPSAREIRRDAGHFVYVPECRIVLGALLAPQICADPPGVDRESAHDAISASVADFFGLELPEASASQP